MRLAVIGTAGRGTDAGRIDRSFYDEMYRYTKDFAETTGAKSAVSGGAAVADHLAVRLFIEGAVQELKLHLPARFERGRFVGHNRVTLDVASTTNRYHEAFSKACGVDSLGQLASVLSSAKVSVFEGFKRRNLEVAADCDSMIALTFGLGDVSQSFASGSPAFTDPVLAGLKDGGTAHTWSECWRPDIKRHINLNQLSGQSL